ncbi:hypothetical protein G9A89_003116 [Geosiphon pyriformis]|nr:hypothetical protein G9A89_003116 [Geosiphon pyriformis]
MATLETAQNYSPTWLGLASQLGISSSISLYCLLQFEWNRRKKSMEYLYTPRTRLSKNASPPIPPGLFSWINATLFLPEKFYLQNVGLDAVMYIRFLGMALKFLLFNVVVVCSILMPINYFGKGEEKGVQVFSVNNLSSDNYEHLWAHMICTYIVSLSWMYLLYINYWDYMMMRRDHFMNKARSGSVSARTIMVSRIPEELRSEEQLKAHFEALGVGSIESARLVREMGKLNRKIARRENALLALEKAHIQLARNVCKAIKKRHWYNFGPGLCGYLSPTNKDVPSTTVEDGSFNEYQNLQSLAILMGQPKKKEPQTGGSQEQHANVDGAVTGQSAITATASTFSSNEDFLEQEDGYGRQFLIWEALRKISKSTLDKYQPFSTTGYCGTGNRVRSIDHFLKKFNYLDRRIAELRAIYINERPPKPTSTAFITFHSHANAQMAAQSIMESKPHTCTTKMAPEPRDILWENLSMRFREKMARFLFVNASVWALTIFWLFPIFAFLTLTSIDSLSQRIHFLGPFLDARPIVRTLLQNVLPTVLVSFFMAMLPWILMEISKQESFPCYSELEEAVLVRYYHFSFFNVFIVFLLGITFLESIFDVINQPTSIIETLAKSLPQGATFFIYYIIFNICTHGLELIQVGSQLFLHILLTSRFVATTPRMLQRVTHPWPFQFYYYYPNHILILVMTITYSTINPLIIIFSLVYYAIAYVVYKHQFAYCYVRRYESGGKFFRRVFGYTTDGLIIFQLTIIGLIWLRTAIIAGAFLVPLVVGTGYFKYYCHKTFYSRTHFLALDTRIEMEILKAKGDDLGQSEADPADRIVDSEKNNLPNDTTESINEKPSSPVVISSNAHDREKQDLDDEKFKENRYPSPLHGSLGSMFARRSFGEGFQRLEGRNASSESVSDSTTAVLKANLGENISQGTNTSSRGSIFRESDASQSQMKPRFGLTDLPRDLTPISSGKLKTKTDDPNLGKNPTDVEFQQLFGGRFKGERGVSGLTLNLDGIKGSNQGGISALKEGKLSSPSQKEPHKVQRVSLQIIPQSIDNTEKGPDTISESNEPINRIILTASPKGQSGSILPSQMQTGFLNVPSHTPRTPSGILLRANLNLAHDPNRISIQDDTSPYQTYFHPNLVKALNRKLWLPRNPLKKITIEDTVELDRALTSSEGGSGVVGYWGGASGFLGEARISMYDTNRQPVFPIHERAATDGGCLEEHPRMIVHRRAMTENAALYRGNNDNPISPISREFGEGGAPFSPCFPLTPEEEGIVLEEDFESGELETGELTSGETF